MAQPRRLDEIWPLARAPRFRLLAFVHFLRAVDGLEGSRGAGRATAAGGGAAGIGAAGIGAADPKRRAALRTLGIDDGAEASDVKRAYRRLARALHPDLQPEVDGERRRLLERRFAEVTAAYEALI
jgi:DnaJ-domain-containing protein 1